jgi:uncharacterized iron-regulated membrane protein
MIISNAAFLWSISAMVAGIAVTWAIWDGRDLIRLWSTRRENQDEFFGAVMGLVIVGIGVSGLIRHHLSW